MSNINVLPSREHTFQINVQGSESGKQFTGSFTYRKPSLGTRSEISKTMARLNEGLKTLDEDTLLLHEIWATLRHTLVKAPEWWEQSAFGYDLDDINVLVELYKECKNFETNYFKKLVEPAEEQKKPEPKEALTKKK